MKTVFIYALKDPRDGAVRYIGKANDPSFRFRRHLRAVEGTHKANWIRQLRGLSLIPVLEILDEIPRSQWEFFERAYIKVYRESGALLTNLTKGGDGVEISCPVVLARMAAKRRGSKHSPEIRRKMSEAQTGEKNHRFGKPGTNLGRKFSPEHCANISRGKMGGRPKVVWTPARREEASKVKLGERNPQFGKTGTQSPNFGKKLTDAQKRHLSLKQSEFQRKKKEDKNVLR